MIPLTPSSMVGSLLAFCAPAASGHAAAAPPSVTMNSRRRIWIGMRPSAEVMQRRGQYHTWTCCAAGFQTDLCRLGVVCHEDRRSKRRYVTVREMKVGPSRSAIRC